MRGNFFPQMHRKILCSSFCSSWEFPVLGNQRDVKIWHRLTLVNSTLRTQIYPGVSAKWTPSPGSSFGEHPRVRCSFSKRLTLFETRPQGRGLGHFSREPCKVLLPWELFKCMARIQKSPKGLSCLSSLIWPRMSQDKKNYQVWSQSCKNISLTPLVEQAMCPKGQAEEQVALDNG